MKQKFQAYSYVYRQERKNHIKKWSFSLLALLIAFMFIPWTQNIRAKGKVTALKQQQRPQQINTIIGGSVVKWYVKEGDLVEKGDTIVQLSEIKQEYLDPQLLQRTDEQILSKEASIQFYSSKVKATENQIAALGGSLTSKLDQLKSKLLQVEVKIRSDSAEMAAAINDWKIASLQYSRQKSMHDSGLVSLTQLESRNQVFQSSLAKKISAENRYQASLQERKILEIEWEALRQDYAEKFSKAEGDKFGSLSQVETTKGEIAKLRNQYASYSIRNGMYYILAPQSGQIVQARTSGLGEVVKEGEALVHIVPDKIDYAVELYVRPVDLPLIAPGQKVRFLFDGFPAIVFSGWPNASYGTYEGIVSAVESDVSENGKFKILISENANYRKWPAELKMGTGANGIALLKDVPIWYELWRNINSFPPDYYQPVKTASEK